MADMSEAADEVKKYGMEHGIAGRRWGLCLGKGLEGEEDVRALLCEQ